MRRFRINLWLKPLEKLLASTEYIFAFGILIILLFVIYAIHALTFDKDALIGLSDFLENHKLGVVLVIFFFLFSPLIAMFFYFISTKKDFNDWNKKVEEKKRIRKNRKKKFTKTTD